jgi:hypothetical protein
MIKRRIKLIYLKFFKFFLKKDGTYLLLTEF